VDDFHVRLTPVERSAVKNALLAISQVEVAVKKFWGRLGDRLPKPEFEQVGATFAESEVRHADAYSHLLEVLGLNADFDRLLAVPAIRGRVDYLAEATGPGKTDEDFAAPSPCSRCSSRTCQPVRPVRRRQGHQQAPQPAEGHRQRHPGHAEGGAGPRPVRRARRQPDSRRAAGVVRAGVLRAVEAACRKAYRYESAIVDWIYRRRRAALPEAADLKEFLKARFNESLAMVGGRPVFDTDPALLEPPGGSSRSCSPRPAPTSSTSGRSPTAKFTKPITAEDLF
jgi:ribonucleoside-diphosphate reductase beta chain